MKKTLLFTVIVIFCYITLTSNSDGAAQHGNNCTGSAGGIASCSTGSSCHGSNSAATNVQLSVCYLNTTNPITEYTPEADYTVNITATNNAALPGFGFQVSAVSAGSIQAGSFTVGSYPDQHTNLVGYLEVIEHKHTIDATIPGQYNTSFTWTAPIAGKGKVKFYGILCAVDEDGTAAGDAANAAPVVTVGESGGTSVTNLANNAELHLFPNPFSNDLHLKINNASGDYLISVYNLSGQRIANRLLSLQSDDPVTINTNDWAMGIYQVQVRHGNAVKTLTAIKQ